MQRALYGLGGLLIVVSLALYGADNAWWMVPFLIGLVTAAAGATTGSPRMGVAASAIVHLGGGLYLLNQKIADTQGTALCDINQVFSCGTVNGSEYSVLFGLPVSGVGAAVSAGVLFAALRAKDDDVGFFRVATAVGALSTLFSVYMFWASTQLGAWCIVCLSMYAANLVLLWAGLKGLKGLGESFSADFGKALLPTFAFGAFTLVGVMTVYNASTKEESVETIKKAANPSQLLAKYIAAPSGEVSISGNEPVLGDPNAPYVIVEWADYGCPHCAQASKILKDMVKAMPQVQLRYKFFPLDGNCNDGLQPAPSPERCVAAFAAYCAGQQDRFYEMSDLLFRYQPQFSDEQIALYARTINLDQPAFNACLEDPATLAAVKADAEAGRKAGVQGTPALFLRGAHGDEWVEAARGPESLAKIVEAHSDGVSIPAPAAR